MEEVLKITEADLGFIENMLTEQDVVGALGKCEDYLDDEGYCRACTAMQRLGTFLTALDKGEARIVWDS